MSDEKPTIFQNLNATVIVGAVFAAVVSEYIHPHPYGLYFFPSLRMDIGGKTIHIHHWILALGVLAVYARYPFKNIYANSLTLGALIGILAQGVSYSTAHWILYDEELYAEARYAGKRSVEE